jgi:hypothetical protein
VLDVLSFLNMFLKVELKSKSANVKLILSTSFQKRIQRETHAHQAQK